MEKQNDELIQFFGATITKKGNGVILTFVRGDKPDREFFRCYLPYANAGKSIWMNEDNKTIELKSEARPYEPRKAKPAERKAVPSGVYTPDATTGAKKEIPSWAVDVDSDLPF